MLQTIKTETEIEKMKAEIEKLRAEAKKINRDYGLLPMAIGASLTIALTGVATLVVRLIVG